jgi:hypothetical protein
MGQNHFAPVPTAVYGLSLLMPATAWYFLQTALIRSQGSNSLLARAIGRDFKGKASFVLYIVGIVSAFIDTRVSDATYVLVAFSSVCLWYQPSPLPWVPFRFWLSGESLDCRRAWATTAFAPGAIFPSQNQCRGIFLQYPQPLVVGPEGAALGGDGLFGAICPAVRLCEPGFDYSHEPVMRSARRLTRSAALACSARSALASAARRSASAWLGIHTCFRHPPVGLCRVGPCLGPISPASFCVGAGFRCGCPLRQ